MSRIPESCLDAIFVVVLACVLLPCQSGRAGQPQAKSSGEATAETPNILLILADDMGYGDLGCMGSKTLKTPHLDALADRGTLCTQAYVTSPVCSPSRAGLLTGRDPRRFGYEGNLNQGAANYPTRPELLGLPPGEHTLGDHLQAAGYSTALIGKWHQGIGPGFHPQERGFQYFCGMLGGSHNYFPDPQKNKLERNGEPLNEFSSPYLTDFFTDEAVQWIRSAKQAEKPWFLYLAYNAPHGPLQATEEDLAQFSDIQDRKRRTYAAMMYAMDRGVGRITNLLKQTGDLNNTLIVFLSDNGGATNNGSWNGPLSGVKGCLREGGIRIPTIVSWPNGSVPSGESYDGIVSSLDLLPTFLSASESSPLPLAKARSHEDRRNRQRLVKEFGAYEGRDLLPYLQGKSQQKDRKLFWRLQGQAAVLQGDHKLIRLSHRPAQMFSPHEDLGEQMDLASKESSTYFELFRELGNWEASLPTAPLWDSSPFWRKQSAKHYDEWGVKPELQ